MIEGIQELALNGEVHLPVDRYHLGDGEIGVDPLGIMQPQERADGSSIEIRADICGIGLAQAGIVLGIEEIYAPAGSMNSASRNCGSGSGSGSV